mgnify:CR=1 FL=1
MFLTASEIRAKFNIQQNGFASQLPAAMEIAGLYIREAVEADVYAEADGGDLATTHANYIRQRKVVQSQAYLAWYFLLKDAGNALSDKGVIKQFQAGSSPATQSVHMNQVLTPAELEAMKQSALESAKMLLSDYGTILIEEVLESDYESLITTTPYF